MGKRHKKAARVAEVAKSRVVAGDSGDGAHLPASYWKACELARDGKYTEARAVYARLERRTGKPNSRLRSLIRNDLAVLDAVEGKFDEAREGWRAAIEGDGACLPARLNLGLVQAELAWTKAATPVTADGANAPDATEVNTLPIVRVGPEAEKEGATVNNGESLSAFPSLPRVAVISLLFNWPSTGGGNMHTAGLVEFLGRDGFDVRHFYAGYPAWGIGRVEDDGYAGGAGRETCGQADGGVGDPRPTGEEGERETCGRADGGVGDPRRAGAGSEAIEFGDGEWNVAAIRQRFRAAVDSFGPDYVVISDTWNMKPHLAEAMRGYPTLLMEQAQECLCPLNNLRLIGIGPARVEQCPRNQFATPRVCHQCLAERGHHAGALHQAERALAGVGTAEYDRILRQSFFEAEAVVVQ